MHMADALASPAVAAVMGAATIGVTAYSIHKLKKEQESPARIPLMGVMGAFVFAAQMLNFSIPGTGSSGHISGAFLLAVLLGPYAGFLSMIVILLLQCLLFADGGLMVLGCNIWNMAFYAIFIGYFLIYRPITAKGLSRTRIMVASVIACILSLQAGAFSVVLETTLSGITALPFGAFVGLMQPIHLAIGAVEGVLTGLVLIFLLEARPEILHSAQKSSRLSYKTVLAILAVVTLVLAGGVSLVASSDPDGLEWSIGKTTGGAEVEASGSSHDAAADIVDSTAVLPDYSIKGSDSGLGTSLSGIIGVGAVALVCTGVSFGVMKKRKRNSKNYAENGSCN